MSAIEGFNYLIKYIMIKKTLINLIERLTDEECHLINDVLLQVANHGETNIELPYKLNELIDIILTIKK